MKFLIMIAFTIVLSVAFFFIGRLLGNFVGRKKTKQNEIKQNGNAHV